MIGVKRKKSTITRIILLWRDKKLLAAGVNLTQVISGLTVVKCYFADSFAKMTFRQPMRMDYPSCEVIKHYQELIYNQTVNLVFIRLFGVKS